ncbi:Ubiquitin fusion degradation protein 4, partial [Basidiobolus ranarum]
MNLDIAGSFGFVRYGELSDGYDMAQRSENEYEDFSEGFDDNLNEAMEYDETNDAADRDEYNDEDQEYLESHMFETSFSGLNRMRGVSGVSTRLKSILRHLKCYQEPSVQLAALQKLAEIFSIATEDTLTKYFTCDPFIKELVNLMKGAELRNEEENSEIMLLACRCLSNLIEALPSALSNVVYNGAVSTLCSKLMEIQYIDLAEQALSALERISAEYPTSILREGGLVAVLSYLDFFSTNVQRTAVTTVANCSRNVPKEYFGAIKEVIPILKRLLSYSDQKIVEQACLALVRLVESFKYNTKYLESIVTKDLTQNILDLISSPTSSIVSPYIYTKLLTLIRHSAKGSSNLTSELLQDNIIEVLYQVLTGSVFRNNEPNHLKSDSAALTKLLNRPSDQVCEALGIAIELLPHLPKEEIITTHRKDSNGKKKVLKSNYNSRMRLLEKYPDTMTKFSEILLPTLIEVFSSNVVIAVRLRVITTLLKIIYYAKEEVLVRVLKDVPFAGFIAAIPF